MKFRYPNYGHPEVFTSWEEYLGGGICLQLLMEDGERWGVATVQCEKTKQLPPFSAFIKDYSENAGVVSALLAAGIIEGEPIAEYHAPYLTIFAYRFTAEAIQEITTAKEIQNDIPR